MLPMLRPALWSAAAVIFLFSFTSFGVAKLLGGPTHPTLEVEIARRATQLGDVGGAAALSAMQLCLLAIVIVLDVATPATRRRSNCTARLRRASHAAARASARRDGRRWPRVVAHRRTDRRPGGPLVRRRQRMVADGVEPARQPTRPAPALGFGVDPLGLDRGLAAIRRRRRAHRHGDRLPGGHRDHLVAATRQAARRRPDAAARHVRGDHRPRHADHLRHRTVRLAGASGGWFRSDTRWSPCRSSFAPCLSVLRSIPRDLRAAAATLGASPVRAWWQVDARALRRPLLAGAGFSAAISLGEFGATTFLSRTGTETLADRDRPPARQSRSAAAGAGLRDGDDPAGAVDGRRDGRRARTSGSAPIDA